MFDIANGGIEDPEGIFDDRELDDFGILLGFVGKRQVVRRLRLVDGGRCRGGLRFGHVNWGGRRFWGLSLGMMGGFRFLRGRRLVCGALGELGKLLEDDFEVDELRGAGAADRRRLRRPARS